MSLIDQLAEKHILAALRQGDLDNLPGTGHTRNWMMTRMYPRSCVPATGS